MKKIVLFTFSVILALSSCKKEENNPTSENPLNPDHHHILISNEGPFQSGSGTISRINLNTGGVENDLFESANGFPLGNIVQSTYVYNNRVYAMVTNAQKIEVTSYPGFTATATIEGLGKPKYMIEYNGKGYVSDWDVNGIQVIDLASNEVSATITTGSGPENMLIHDNHLFVANSGGEGTDNKVSVIDLNNNNLLTQITVGDNPRSLVLDGDGNIRVLCYGISDWVNPDNDTPGSLATIHPDNLEVVSTLEFDSSTNHPSHLQTDFTGNQLYFLLNDDIYQMESNSEILPDDAWVSGNFYSLGYHPEAQSLLATDAADYASDGTVHVFDHNGNEQAVFNVGVIPSHIFPL